MTQRGTARPPWNPPPHARDEQLAFLAARDELQRSARPRYLTLLRILSGGSARSTRGMAIARSGGMHTGQDYLRERQTEAFGPYVIACDEVAARLSLDERRRLRAEGVLPDWFLPEVVETAKAIKRESRA